MDCTERKGNFFFVGQEDAVGAGVRRLESRVGQGRSRGSGRLGSRGEVEGRERGIGIVGVTGVSIGRILFRRVKKMLWELGGGLVRDDM